MYFDAVVCNDQTHVIFNGTYDETRDFVWKNMSDLQGCSVAIGETLKIVTIEEYMENYFVKL